MTIDLEARRAELLDLRRRIQHAANDLHADRDESGEINSPAGDQHMADHATELLERELDDSIAENADTVVEEIDEALARIDAGTYGTCAECGQEIPEERLAALPYAVLCVEDKRRREQGL